MLNTAIFSRVRTAAGRFAKADQGNIAVLFAIAAVPILSFVGAAIDYTRANSARSSMQAALDSTALMVAKDLADGTIKASDINTKAQAYFTALYTNNDARAVTVTATYTANTGKGSTIKINGSGNVPTDFMKVAGFPKIGFDTSSTSALGQRPHAGGACARRHRIDGRRRQDGPRCKPAAKALIDQLGALAKNTGDVYISLIPFAKDVNVGASNYRTVVDRLERVGGCERQVQRQAIRELPYKKLL